ncbi:hypothetical protein J6590_019031 [Homalodisca vitripennis]|nr:hypothetical protein J6590_019031 [Homalodisca vitripennis]
MNREKHRIEHQISSVKTLVLPSLANFKSSNSNTRHGYYRYLPTSNTGTCPRPTLANFKSSNSNTRHGYYRYLPTSNTGQFLIIQLQYTAWVLQVPAHVQHWSIFNHPTPIHGMGTTGTCPRPTLASFKSSNSNTRHGYYRYLPTSNTGQFKIIQLQYTAWVLQVPAHVQHWSILNHPTPMHGMGTTGTCPRPTLVPAHVQHWPVLNHPTPIHGMGTTGTCPRPTLVPAHVQHWPILNHPTPIHGMGTTGTCPRPTLVPAHVQHWSILNHPIPIHGMGTTGTCPRPTLASFKSSNYNTRHGHPVLSSKIQIAGTHNKNNTIISNQEGSLMAGLYLPQKPIFNLQLGNPMDVHRSSLLRGMTVEVGAGLSVKRRHRARLAFFQGEMTEINGQNPSSRIST